MNYPRHKFLRFCQNGDLESLRKLKRVSPVCRPAVQLAREREFDSVACMAFLSACRRGQLSIAQWMHETIPAVRVMPSIAFQIACDECHLHVAEWLLQVNPDLAQHTRHNVFRTACCHTGRLFVAQWLWEEVRPDTNAWTEKDYRTDIMPLFSRAEEAWHALATQVLATHPEWDEERARRLGLLSAYLMK